MQKLQLATAVFILVLTVLAEANGKCGKITKKRTTSNKIYNGQPATRGSIPWQVSLSCGIGDTFCGGSLISKKWVLTAAHCVIADQMSNSCHGQRMRVSNRPYYQDHRDPYDQDYRYSRNNNYDNNQDNRYSRYNDYDNNQDYDNNRDYGYSRNNGYDNNQDYGYSRNNGYDNNQDYRYSRNNGYDNNQDYRYSRYNDYDNNQDYRYSRNNDYDNNQDYRYSRYNDHDNNRSSDFTNMVVTVGGDKQRSWEDRHPNYYINNVIVHDRYNDEISNDNDIALLELEKPVKFSSLVTPICLPKEYRSFTPKNFRISGWGVTENKRMSDVLRTTTIPRYSKETCVLNIETTLHQTLTGRTRENKVTDNMICAGSMIGGRDTCHGDSGGPLSYKRKNVWYLEGVASFGHDGCGGFGKLGVYTNVRNYLRWIIKNTGRRHW